jgi:DNA-binding XRE family transcriptional regulator
MKKLVTYLTEQNIRQADFALAVGASQPTISKLMSGCALPSLSLAVAIERATGGAVMAADWMGDRDQAKEAS